MNADTVIEQIRKLRPEDLEKVSEFLEEMEGDRLADKRDREIEEGKVKPLSEAEVFSRLRSRLE
jgi:hypothetical protein